MVHFGLRHTGDCMINFPDGLYSLTRMQLLSWVLQVPTTNRNCRCQGKNQNDERHPHIQEGPDHSGHILQPLEYKTPSLPFPNKKNEDLFRTRGQAWHPTPITTTHQHYLPDKNFSPCKTIVPKKTEKKKRVKVPVKRRFKMTVIAQPIPINLNLSVNPILPADL